MGGGEKRAGIYATLISSGLLQGQCYLQSLHVTLIRKGQHSCKVCHQNHTDGEVARIDKIERLDGRTKCYMSKSEPELQILNQADSCHERKKRYTDRTYQTPPFPHHRIQLHGHKFPSQQQRVMPQLFPVCLIYLFLGSTNLPRKQARDKGWHVHVPSGLWRYLQFSANSQVVENKGWVGGIGPGCILALRQHLRKVEPVKKKTWSWVLADTQPPIAFP